MREPVTIRYSDRRFYWADVCAPIDAFGELDEPGHDGGRGGACVALDVP